MTSNRADNERNDTQDARRKRHLAQMYAHTKRDADGNPLPKENWEPLFSSFGADTSKNCLRATCAKCERLVEDHGHLNKVAWWVSNFAGKMFPAGQDRKVASRWGYTAGLWHDLGKFSNDFQLYLGKAGGAHESEVLGQVDHTSAGAQYACKSIPIFGHLLAYPIAGHHTGLLDAAENTASQRTRLQKCVPPIETAWIDALEQNLTERPGFIDAALRDPKTAGFATSFFTRMLFSCLCDADFLATEAFMNPERSQARPEIPDNLLGKMMSRLNEYLDNLTANSEDTLVNRKRSEALKDCRLAAENDTGLFTLSVPTGGGKTLSSLAFALKHATAHGLNRVIYVAPFTSIIEQNADVYREIFRNFEAEGFDPVLEHHSSLSPEKETTQSRLATENWEAPLVVTTAVQFYESLYACKTSKARKLHNIAQSVIILDEAQTLPVTLLHPCLAAIRELTENYESSVILCTATQPAVAYDEDFFPIGLKGCREIIRAKVDLFAALNRVEIVYRGEIADADLVAEIRSEHQALCIVNRRKHAYQLFSMLGEGEGNFHLSALMCPEHRSEILTIIGRRLNRGEEVRVISTQLVEAGVDVDFPVVYRALAGLDSIAQAAGRCNRNGRLNRLGATNIFKPEHRDEESYFRQTAQVAEQVIAQHQDLLGEDAIRQYFDLYYYQRGKAVKWDEKGIMDCFRVEASSREFPFLFDFKQAASKFRLIDSDYQTSVIIPYGGKATGLIEQLRNESIPLYRDLVRGLQRFTVQIPNRLFEDNRSEFESVREDEFHVLISPELNYSTHFGLCFADEHQNSQLLHC